MGGDNSAPLQDWIEKTPEAVVFSTHTASGPLPRIPDVNIISVMLLRDPVARIRSAYRFERKQVADTWGAKLAKDHDLAGYVEARLARKGDRQCRNFQTGRLASLVPGPAPELERAILGMNQLSVLGLVEDFNGSLQRLCTALHPHFPDFVAQNIKANTTQAKPESEEDPHLTRRLLEANIYDRALWQSAMDRFQRT